MSTDFLSQQCPSECFVAAFWLLSPELPLMCILTLAYNTHLLHTWSIRSSTGPCLLSNLFAYLFSIQLLIYLQTAYKAEMVSVLLREKTRRCLPHPSFFLIILFFLFCMGQDPLQAFANDCYSSKLFHLHSRFAKS